MVVLIYILIMKMKHIPGTKRVLNSRNLVPGPFEMLFFICLAVRPEMARGFKTIRYCLEYVPFAQQGRASSMLFPLEGIPYNSGIERITAP